MKIPGFGRTTTAGLRKNRRNYVIILVLWIGFIVFTIVDKGEAQPAAWIAIAVVIVVLLVAIASELEIRRRAAVAAEAKPTDPAATTDR